MSVEQLPLLERINRALRTMTDHTYPLVGQDHTLITDQLLIWPRITSSISGRNPPSPFSPSASSSQPPSSSFFRCSLCSKKFSSEQTLQSHQGSKHRKAALSPSATAATSDSGSLPKIIALLDSKPNRATKLLFDRAEGESSSFSRNPLNCRV